MCLTALSPRAPNSSSADRSGSASSNDPTLDRINSYGVVDLNFLYVPNHANWTAQLTATNIGNVAGIDSKYTDPYGTGQTSVEYIPPFQIIGSVSYKF